VSTIAEIKARLRGPGSPFAMVQGATALAQVKDKPEALPAAFVLTAKEVSGENMRATGNPMQRLERDIMIVTVSEDLGDPDGDAAQDQVELHKDWVRSRINGWVPPSMQEPITHVSGEIVEARAGAAWFEDTFSAPTYLIGEA
jgi:hypothetical protein